MDKILKYRLRHHKSPRGKHRQKISDNLPSNFFANIFPRARDIKERINKWNYIKLKSFCIAKENVSKMKREVYWENIFANDTLDKGLISKMYEVNTLFSYDTF